MVITIFEGKTLGITLARVLRMLDHHVIIVQKDKDADITILKEMNAAVISRDATDISILTHPGIEGSDIIISLMDSDADNLLTCLYLKNKYNIKKILTKVNKSKYLDYYEQLGIDIAFDLAKIAADLGFADLQRLNTN